MSVVSDDDMARALARFAGMEGASAQPLGAGLINKTWLVTTADGKLVLQRVNRIFDPLIHLNIQAVTNHLAGQGIQTPRILISLEGRP